MSDLNAAKGENIDNEELKSSLKAEKEGAKDDRRKKGLYSVLKKSLEHSSQRIKNDLMSIANMCHECELSAFAED